MQSEYCYIIIRARWIELCLMVISTLGWNAVYIPAFADGFIKVKVEVPIFL